MLSSGRAHSVAGRPVGIEQGLRWIQASVFEGFYVAFRVDKSAALATVWLKKWEFGEMSQIGQTSCVA